MLIVKNLGLNICVCHFGMTLKFDDGVQALLSDLKNFEEEVLIILELKWNWLKYHIS